MLKLRGVSNLRNLVFFPDFDFGELGQIDEKQDGYWDFTELFVTHLVVGDFLEDLIVSSLIKEASVGELVANFSLKRRFEN